MITIINYGLGNIRAFVNVYRTLDIKLHVATHFRDVLAASHIILPGVGAFDQAMQKLQASGMKEAACEMALVKRIPVLGICVGMQMLARNSDEGSAQGLGWIAGEVKSLSSRVHSGAIRLPHMGWNDVKPCGDCDLFSGVQQDVRFYFLHSYYFKCDNMSDIVSRTDYAGEFASAVANKNIYGVQFHPEKSHARGTQLLHNFAKLGSASSA